MIADDATLARLMASAQRGDRQAYRVLLREAENWLRRYFRRRVAPAQMEDLIQEVLAALHAKRASYDPARAFLPWLAAIARYRWVDHLRKAYRREEAALEEQNLAVEDEGNAIAARVSLERLFEHLPPGQVEVIELVKIEGHSIAEAARSSGQSESLVKVNIHRGLKKLSALVEEAE